MTAPLRHGLLLIALATSAFAADAASPVIARQIDELLRHRLRPEPLPIDLPNPFATTGATIQRSRPTTIVENTARNGHGDEPGTSADREAARASHAEILADCASRLRVGGTIRLKDQVQIVINDTPRKQGDLLIVPYQATRIPIEIVRLLPDRVVLRYLDAEIAVKF